MVDKNKLTHPVHSDVVKILNKLQGTTMPSYQGLKCFWLDLESFKNAALYGQKLIAPNDNDSKNSVKSSGCCGSSEVKTEPIVTTQPIKSGGCCGGDVKKEETEENPAVISVHQPPTKTIIGDCWPSGGGNGTGSGTGKPKRSDLSGIIIGLKGQAPFDGTIFPKLLWDAKYEPTESEIQLIADWIDLDCPVEQLNDDKKLKQEFVQNKQKSLARGEQLHTVSTNKTGVDHRKNKGLTIRKEISSLTKEELKTYRDAINCMKQYDDFWQDERSFDFWARIHTNSCQHGWEQFVTWHRAYLYFFEQKLQDYDPNIAIPYWSWADYSKENTKSFNNTKPDLGVIPKAFQCFLSKEGYDSLVSAKTINGDSLFTKQELSGLENIYKKEEHYNSGLRFLNAANIKYEVITKEGEDVWSDKVRTIYNTLIEINPLWFPNRWPGSYTAAGPIGYPNKEDIDNILTLDNFGDFGGGPSYDHHYGSLEKIHNGMHLFSGGTNPHFTTGGNPQSLENPPAGWMTDNRTTAFDPIFWSHHANVDRLWALWQEKHNGTPQDMNGALPPWSFTVQDTMSTQKLGYDYMKDSVFFDVSSVYGLMNFKSNSANISKETLENHQKAEIKLHRMRRGNLPNASIRVFLNSPDATYETPIIGNENFVEEITTFHGSCYGGPGHCNLPLDNTRVFDHRPLHHHEPRNYKINATKSIKQLLEKGEKDITIQLVVVGSGGKPIDNAIFIDGVSLNFKD